MKKSEMQIKIADFLYKTYGFGDTESTICSSEIMDLIEKEGMVPPENSKPIHHYNLDALQCLRSTYHTWDEE